MMVLQVIPDPFKASESGEAFSQQTIYGRNPLTRGRGLGVKVRRPVRGIQTKGDTFASIRLVASDGDGRTIRLVDAGSRDTNQEIPFKSSTYTNFLLQSVSEERMEKQQILETFGEPYIFLFGERARVMTFQGVLLNTEDFNWEAEWWHNYENYLRGTRCVENKARVFLFFDETLVSGYILATSSQKNAQERNYVPFSFQLFVTSWSTISRLGDPDAQPMKERRVRNSAEARVYLPKKIEDIKTTYSLTNGLTGTAAKVQEGLDLVESLLDRGVRAARSYLNAGASALSASTSVANNILNGTVVRVPVGFAGVLEFDDPFAPAKPTSFEGPVKFGVYADNEDEYISADSQYSSSVTGAGANQVEFGLSHDEEIRRNVKLVEKARELWRQQGLEAPTIGPVSKALIGKGIGLFRLGSSSDWWQKKDDLSGLNDALKRQMDARERVEDVISNLSVGRRGVPAGGV